jgi:ABC-2 type transport system ATP-binding protein
MREAAEEADMGEPAIAVSGLRKRFGAKDAVAGIDLEIAAGSLAGLVGPNGAGKTTSLSMMTGLLRPDAGRIVINGAEQVRAGKTLQQAFIDLVGPRDRDEEVLSWLGSSSS